MVVKGKGFGVKKNQCQILVLFFLILMQSWKMVYFPEPQFLICKIEIKVFPYSMCNIIKGQTYRNIQ